MQDLTNKSFIPSISINNIVYEHCSLVKSHKLPFSLSLANVTCPFQLVHSDVWGPSPTSSFNGFRYYLLFIDEFTKFTWIYPLKHKSEVTAKFILFHAYIQTQFNNTMKVLRTDNGGEYINNSLQTYLQSHDIVHQRTCPHTPKQNGVAERKHRHLIETTVALLHQANLPTSYWLEALCTAVFLINKMPTKVLNNQIPHQLLYHSPPDYSTLRVFGCLCFPWLRPYMDHKLQPRSTKCVFLGYCTFTKGYRCLDLDTKRIYISRHVKFFKNVFPLHLSSNTPSPSPSNIPSISIHKHHKLLFPQQLIDNSEPPIITSDQSSHNSPLSSPSSHNQFLNSPSSPQDQSNAPSSPNLTPPPPLSKPIKPPPAPHSMKTRLKDGIKIPNLKYASLTVTNNIESSNFTESNHSKEWRTTMSSEYNALMEQQT